MTKLRDALSDVAHGHADLSYQLIKTTQVGDSNIAVYRTDLGALSSYGIAVELHKRVMPGLTWVHLLKRAYPAYTATIEALDEHHVRCVIPDRSDDTFAI